jgi:hypothetical protein
LKDSPQRCVSQRADLDFRGDAYVPSTGKPATVLTRREIGHDFEDVGGCWSDVRVRRTRRRAAAQSYEAEIDCGDDWQQGDSVPWTVRFEEQAGQQHSIDVTVTLTRPDGVTKTLVNRNFTLNANQDADFTRFINLPNNAILGDYDMRVTADDGTLQVSDTCGFDVI